MKIDRKKVISFAKFYWQNDYDPPCRPACANFVSKVLNDAGWGHEGINYVPAFFDVFPITLDPKPGDLVIFKQTYDAVYPPGIGKEDDKTHVGILIDTNGDFIHYSSGIDAPAKANCTVDYYKEHFECYLSIDGTPSIPMPEKKYGMMKLFGHDEKIKIIIDGVERKVVSVEMEVKFEA